ncbi:hypothetical protein [Oceanobacillus oncorhynchi]|uniref:hypothetical protein n=1 Tax=Oceanobacillus oncorhynchi TaxID=545501 RepID=UPI0018666E23|nr:hypothetical protein [Oceanobacillus oncorhynchi]
MDERLEEIKRYYSSAESLHPDIQEDIQWLIQQAEKAEELESDIKANKKSVDWLLYQNKRYKEALEKIAFDEKSQFFERCPKIAKEALRGES